MTSPLCITEGEDSASIDMLTLALNAQNWPAAKYLIHRTLRNSLHLDDYKLDNTNKNKDYQLKGYQATRKSKEPFKIHLEYFIEEIKTKGGVFF